MMNYTQGLITVFVPMANHFEYFTTFIISFWVVLRVRQAKGK